MDSHATLKQPKPRKRMHYFETYISKVLREVSYENGIKSNAKQQLNSILCLICEKISNQVIRLTRMSKKKTLSVKEIRNAVKITMIGELAENSTIRGDKAIQNFNGNDSKNTTRQNKADIIFPPSIIEKFLRDFEMSKIMITGESPIYLAAIMEYLCREILDIASNIAIEYKRKRISIRDLELAVKNDPEINSLFINLDLSFLGGGVVPCIHPLLINKKGKKKKKQYITPEKDKSNKKHRFRPGTVALREIRKYQKSTDPLFAKQPFERLVRNMVNNYNTEMKISKDVFTIMQYFIEQYITDVLYSVGLAAIHAGRVKILSSDISFICMCKNIQNPTIIDQHIEILSISDQDSNLDDIDEDLKKELEYEIDNYAKTICIDNNSEDDDNYASNNSKDDDNSIDDTSNNNSEDSEDVSDVSDVSEDVSDVSEDDSD